MFDYKFYDWFCGFYCYFDKSKNNGTTYIFMKKMRITTFGGKYILCKVTKMTKNNFE